MSGGADQAGGEGADRGGGVEGVEVAPGVHLEAGAMRFTFSRSSGPGGQNVNKLNTRATLHVSLDALAERLAGWAMRRLVEQNPSRVTEEEIQISSESERSQIGNRRACMERLREMIVAAMNRPKRRRPTKPSKASKQRRLDEKKRRGEIKRRRGKLEE